MSTQTRDQRRAQARAEREAAERAAAAHDQRRTRLLQLGAVLAVAAAIIAGVVLLTGGGDDDATTAGSGTQAPAAGEAVNGKAEIATQLKGIPQDGLVLGDKQAPVTVVEFADLQCPVCAQFSNTMMPSIVDEHVRPGDVRFELRTLSFLGDDSVRLGQMAQAAARQDRLFDFTELVYANQGAENSGYATDDYLRRIASAIPGLDVDQALQQRNDDEAAQALADADRLAGIEGVQGTPSFLVGPTGGELKLVDASELDAEIDRLTAAATPQR